MKNLINWLTVALIFVCLQTSKAQIDPSLLSMKNRPIPNAPVAVQSTPRPVPRTTQEVNDNILSDFPLSNQPTTPFKDLLAKKQAEKDTKSMLDKAFDEWDAIFEKEEEKRAKVRENAFNIFVDTVVYREHLRPKPTPKGQTAVVNPDTFDFKKNKMSVQYDPVTKQFIAVKEEGQKVAETLGIVEDTPDTLFFVDKKQFTYKGETWTKIDDSELETPQYKAPRPKHAKPANRASVRIESNEQFVDLYDDIAADGERYGVPAAITMAQGILESRGGRSRMAVQINNLFGIKCEGGRCHKQNCPHGYFTDDRQDETFRGYPNFEASFRDHIRFLRDNSNYDKCFECGTTDIECWLYRLYRSGYATDTMYDYKLAQIINRYKLTAQPIRYDRRRVKDRLSGR